MNNLNPSEQDYYLNAPCQKCGKPNAMNLIRIDDFPYWVCMHCEKEKQDKLDKESERWENSFRERDRKRDLKRTKELDEKARRKLDPKYCPECLNKHENKDDYGFPCTNCQMRIDSLEDYAEYQIQE